MAAPARPRRALAPNEPETRAAPVLPAPRALPDEGPVERAGPRFLGRGGRSRARRAPLEVPSLARAQALFEAIARHPDIPHHFPHEGCHFRAHLTAHWLEGQGVESFKVFALPENGSLRISTPRSEPGFTVAKFHVAVAVPVMTEAGAAARIFDPACFQAPVPAEAWLEAMRDLGGGAVGSCTLPRFAFRPSDVVRTPSNWRTSDLDEAADWKHHVEAKSEELRRGGFFERLERLREADS